MILHYLKVAWRNLWKYKMQSLISIVGLAVGLFSFSLCAYLFRYWLSEDEGFRNHKRVVEMVMFDDQGQEWSGSPAALAPEMRERNFESIERLTAMAYARRELLKFSMASEKEVVYELGYMEVDSNFMSVLGIHLLQGNIKQIYAEPNTLVLTESTVRKVFGTQNPIGIKVTSSEGVVYTIHGIVEDLPQNNSLSSISINILAFSVQNGKLMDRRPGHTGCLTFALLRPGVSTDVLNRQMKSVEYRHNNEYVIVAHPLGKTRAMEFIFLYGLTLFIGSLVLLSALLNYFSFTMGSFFNRMKEFNIRRGIGQGGRNLFFMLFTELGISLFLAGGIAFCLTELLMSGYSFQFFNIRIDFQESLLLLQIAQYLLACIVLAMLISLLFCFRVRRMNLQAGMYHGGIRGSKHRGRNILLGVQFFICILFLTAGSVAYMQSQIGVKKTLESLKQEEKERIFRVRLDYPQLENYHSVILEKLKGDSRIEDILRIEDGLMSFRTTGLTWEGNEQYIECCYLRVSDNFTSFMHLPLLQGKGGVTEHAMLVDEQFAKLFKDAPVNKFVFQEMRTVSGVIPIIHRWPDIKKQLLIVLPIKEGGNCYVKILSDKVPETLLFIENTLKEFLPQGITLDIISLQKECEKIRTAEIILRNVFLFFGIICLIITLLGIYSAISLDTIRRQKEVAIRKINGADTKTIISLFVRLYVVLLLVGTLLSFPIVWLGANASLSTWPVHFNYNNPLFWLLIFVGLAFVIGVTIFMKIVGIVKRNPAETLKSE